MSVLTLLVVACQRGPSGDPPDAGGGDARLCVCLVSGSDCESTSSVDFGDVAVGRTSSVQLRLSACGTQPVTLDAVELTGDSSVFRMTGVPVASTVLQPGGVPFDLQASFTPVSFAPFAGRFSLITASRQLDIDLRGTGIDGRCRLSASTVSVDFGETIVGSSRTTEIELTNGGLEDCTFPTAPAITPGADAKFEIASAPREPLAAGAMARLTLKYTPNDLIAPDVGELTIPHGDAQQTPLTSLVLELAGTPVPAPPCQLEVQPGGANPSLRILDFGTVLVGSTKMLSVTLKNVSTVDCTVTDAQRLAGTLATITGLSPTVYRVVSKPMAPIPPGATGTIEVSFTPDREGDFGSSFPAGAGNAYGINLIVKTSDTTHYSGQDCTDVTLGSPTTRGCMAWLLAGKGAMPRLELMPTSADMEEVTVGCRSGERHLTLFNFGSASATIKALVIDPPTPPGQTPVFALDPSPALPFSLNAGGYLNIPYRFAPSAVGPASATLYIEYDYGIITVSLRGTGTLVSHETETFTQGTIPKNDILFVVDNSGSMAEEQALLSTNAQAFIDELNQSSVDFQIAVVTTDVDSANQRGRFQGSPKIIMPGASAATDLANRITALGTNGSSDEKGLWATYVALSDPMIHDPAENAGFLRPDARLSVIVVSDENDSSPAPPDFYKQFLWSLKARDMVSLSAIVGDASTGCTSPNGDATPGDRYLSVQQATGGQFQSICMPNWTLLAETLAFKATELPNSVQLSREADAASMVVTVNGNPSPATDWTWDVATNSVVFNAGAVPAAGDSVEVNYDAACY